MTKDFNSSKGYKIIKKETKSFLKTYGFKPYKTSCIYRVTDDDILQFINFQKGVSYLEEKMTYNFSFQGLFKPRCSINILQPGGRIGYLLDDEKDYWWKCDTLESVEKSIFEINRAFEKKMLPFFEESSSSEKIVALCENKKFEFVWSNNLTFIDKGYFYLKAEEYDKALEIFESKQPSKVNKYKTIKNLILTENYSEIQALLNKQIENTKDKLGI